MNLVPASFRLMQELLISDITNASVLGILSINLHFSILEAIL